MYYMKRESKKWKRDISTYQHFFNFEMGHILCIDPNDFNIYTKYPCHVY